MQVNPMKTAPAARRRRRGHGRPTLHDVARAAGVTRITVSRFLREPDVVAEPTATRIRDAIAQTGYVPNRQAGQLASGRSRIVAALIPNVGHSIFAETIQGLSEGLRDSGHELLLASTGYSMEREEAQLRALIGWAPAALIVTGRRHSAGALKLLREAHSGGTPVIEIWDHHPDAAHGFVQIGFDHDAVGRAMARHLIERGHTSLVYVDSGVAEDFRAHERGEGFAAEARATGARVKIVKAPTGDPFDAGRRVFTSLHRRGVPRFSAIAFANDHLACGTLMAAQASGVRVPEEMALLGFGDFPIGAQLQPALSSVRPPRELIGRAAAAAALQSAAGGEEVRSRALPWELIERGSTAGASSAPASARGAMRA
jgi:LacI family gluconate utilization system Gnt-I transcriptional repressor